MHATDQTDAARFVLARHAQRRAQGIPTLSVLVGDYAEAARVWQEWVAVEQLSRNLVSGTGGKMPLAVGLAVSSQDAADYLREEPFSRARAMFAEGTVELRTTRAVEPGKTSTDPLVGTTAVLARENVRPATADRFEEAAAACQKSAASRGATDPPAPARSAAERFLFELLGDLADTAGLFALNVRLGFCFGPMPAEVDLLAADLRIAIEIDGFHHFREPENYRRDRRKDALLQRQGYLVLRFLAEDVVVRLEEILDEIRVAVAFRRAAR